MKNLIRSATYPLIIITLTSIACIWYWVSLLDAQRSEMETAIRDELSQVHGLIPILMKRRNGEQWTEEELVVLKRDLRSLSNLSPYLVLIVPGGTSMLLLLAWWMDSRRKRRKN